MEPTGSHLSGFITLLVMAAIYFIPAIVAYKVRHRNRLPIAILNLFLGFTLLGWVIALVWATMSDAPDARPEKTGAPIDA